MALAASQGALWTMTAVSCSIGVLLRSFPSQDRVQPIINVAAATLMIIFGVQSLREAQAFGGAGGGIGIGRPDQVDAKVEQDCRGAQDEAQCEIESALSNSKSKNLVLEWLRFAVLIFLAEWGDRSMFVTVTLAASRSPVGTFLGGCAGHFCAAFVAVVCGGVLQKYVSDRIIRIVGGLLFISFGVTTFLGIY